MRVAERMLTCRVPAAYDPPSNFREASMFPALLMMFVDCPIPQMIPPREPFFDPTASEIRAIEREHHLPTVATLIPLESIDTAQAAEVLSRQFEDIPGVVIEAQLKMRCLTIRADAKTTAAALGLLDHLERMAGMKRGGVNRRAISIRLDNQDILTAIVRWAREQGN